MNRAISLKALQLDTGFLWNRYSYFFKSFWLVGAIFLVLIIFQENSAIIFGLLSLVTFFYRYYKFLSIKKKKEKNQVLLFDKLSNDRERNLYAFFVFIFFTWLVRHDSMWFMFNLMMSIHWLTRYFFYIPAIRFTINSYCLNIYKGFRQKQIDFSYQNRLRFVYNMISFDHPVNGKVVFKNIQLDANKIQQVAKFLEDNFGKEMVNCPQLGNINKIS